MFLPGIFASDDKAFLVLSYSGFQLLVAVGINTTDTKEKPTCLTLVSFVSFVLTQRATNNRQPL